MLDYYSLKSAAAKIGCLEEDLISLAAEDKLSIYFKLGGRTILEMDRGCPDDWQEIAFYIWTQLKIHPLTFQRYQSNPSALLSELMNPDDPEKPGYWLKESVPLKDTTLFVSADDVTRLSQSRDYRDSKRDEPEYYLLTTATEITGYTKDYLICLAADNKLPIYVRLPGNSGIELKETGDPESPDVDGCYLRGLYKVPVFTIQEYINDPLTSLWCLRKYPDNGYYYNLDTKIPLTKIALYISAEDVARLSKNGNDGVVSQEPTEPESSKNIQTNIQQDEIELTLWLRETWVKEDKPGGTSFFNKLKNYVGQKGSPITQHYSAGDDAGIDWKTSYGTTGSMVKKTVLNKVSIFRKNS